MLRGIRSQTADLLRRVGVLAPLPARSPDFIVLGAQKAGTTSLAAWLSTHPDCWIASEKEVHYFDLAYHRGLTWYRSRFGKCPADRKAGDISPFYLFHPLCAERMARELPSVRLVAILRDPVVRAVSGYAHSVRYHGETRPLTEALAAEAAATATDLAALARDPNAPCPNLQTRSYRARGEYAVQLERFLQRFPREQLHVLFFEDLIGRPAPTLAGLCDFLGVRPSEGALPWRNAGMREELEVPQETLAELREHYRPHNERLAALLGRPLPW